jgi:hypothetical protein
VGLRGTQQDKGPVVVAPAAGVQIARRAAPEKKTVTPPLRRAQLIDGNAVVWTDEGAIVNGLEIIHEPSREEASREISARQRSYMHLGVKGREALDLALREVHPATRRAYLR